MLVFSLHRFYTLYASYDQALFDQLFWNTIHGDWFQGSLSSGQSSAVLQDGQVHTVFYCHLGQHFVIDFLLWLPIYALFPNGATLVVLQVTLITAAGIVLYFLARHYLPGAIATFIAASYYGANAVIGPTFANFYEHSQIPLFVFSLLLALAKRKWWFFWLFVILILGIREDTGIILFGIGLYLLLSRSYPRLGVALCLISFGYIALLTNGIMPLFSHDNSRLYLSSFFAKFAPGNPRPNTLQILWGMLSNPGVLLESLFFPLDKRVKYFLGQWLPLAFVPAISPAAWMVSAPPMLVLLIQDRQLALGMSVRFALTVVPGLFYGTILWWHQHQSKFRSLRRWWIRCIVLSVAIAITSSPNQAFYFLIPDSINPWVHIPLTRQWEHVGYTRQLIKLIPPEKSVSATTFVLPLLATRRGIIRFPVLQLRNDLKEVVDVDYVLADLWRLQQYQSAFKVERQQLQDYVVEVDKVLAQGRYGLVDVLDGVVLLEKQISSSPQSLGRWLQFKKEIQNIKFCPSCPSRLRG
ncbi:DUF2079 domain-containing protein [Iningainema tapete]|nr:DUF2079 domain-containing protein [Iningainema tapete]